MPNVHYFAVDFSKFTRIPGIKDSAAGEVKVLLNRRFLQICKDKREFKADQQHVTKPN